LHPIGPCLIQASHSADVIRRMLVSFFCPFRSRSSRARYPWRMASASAFWTVRTQTPASAAICPTDRSRGQLRRAASTASASQSDKISAAGRSDRARAKRPAGVRPARDHRRRGGGKKNRAGLPGQTPRNGPYNFSATESEFSLGVHTSSFQPIRGNCHYNSGKIVRRKLLFFEMYFLTKRVLEYDTINLPINFEDGQDTLREFDRPSCLLPVVFASPPNLTRQTQSVALISCLINQVYQRMA
jgi:hypothetical protein